MNLPANPIVQGTRKCPLIHLSDMHAHTAAAPAGLVMFDVLQGSVERIIASSHALSLLQWLGMKKMIIHSRRRSYIVTTQASWRVGGASEGFDYSLYAKL